MGRILTTITLALVAAAASAAPTLAPGLINYQGMLRDDLGDPLATADYEIAFSLYDDHPAGALVWGPQTFAAVPAAAGHFNLTLGPDDDALSSLTGAFDGQERFLEITVSGDTILPRQQILSAPYALTSNTAGNGVPPGTILPFGGDSIPEGFLVCDGSAVTREIYADLFSAIGTSWGLGDGATTFNVPDLRGMFLRGVDMGKGEDPDSGVRAALNGGNAGDAVGSVQSWATARPQNSATSPGSAFNTDSPGNHSHSRTHVAGIGGTRGFPPAADQSGSTSTSSNGNHDHDVNAGGNAETRPENAYVVYIVKI
jgi:microcystin-dependent protein